jgi:hypothetical protein
MEEWKTIEEFPEYEIHISGLIRNKSAGNILTPSINNRGYLCVCLTNQKVKFKKNLHRLLATTFIPNPLNLECIDHINRDKTDNRLSNLRWCSKLDNNRNKCGKSGFTFIRLTSADTFSVEIKTPARFFKTYKTLEEAIQARDKILTSLNQSCIFE